MEFAPTSQDLAKAHQEIEHHIPQPSSLEEWGEAVEATVDQWLQQKGESLSIPSNLPKAFRGRCREISLQKKPVVSLLKHARQGDYEPPDEILSMKTKRKVTQHRRIESLYRRLKAALLHKPKVANTTMDCVKNGFVFSNQPAMDQFLHSGWLTLRNWDFHHGLFHQHHLFLTYCNIVDIK